MRIPNCCRCLRNILATIFNNYPNRRDINDDDTSQDTISTLHVIQPFHTQQVDLRHEQPVSLGDIGGIPNTHSYYPHYLLPRYIENIETDDFNNLLRVAQPDQLQTRNINPEFLGPLHNSPAMGNMCLEEEVRPLSHSPKKPKIMHEISEIKREDDGIRSDSPPRSKLFKIVEPNNDYEGGDFGCFNTNSHYLVTEYLE